MSDLLELITRTKGIEYLLALGFLFSFVGFWQWHHYKGSRLLVRLAPLGVVALLFAGAASMVISSPATATPREQEFPNVDQAHYLANAYGPAKFAAHEMINIVSCQTCHHHSAQPEACSTCHNEPFDGTASDKPGLKAAYHQRCADCHKDAFSGPMTCTNCHSENPDEASLKKDSPSAVTPPEIAHPLQDQYSNCFACHNPEGQLPLPQNHSGYKANVECLGCHKPSAGNLTATTIQAVQKPAAPAPQQAPQPAAQPDPAPAPAAQPAPEAAAPQPAPAPAAPAPAAQPAAAPQPAASGPATLSHTVAGRENCTMCHQVNGGVKAMPADHAGRTNATCLSCHKAG